MPFPNLLNTAVKALHVAGEPVQYRTRGAATLEAGEVTQGAWGAWTDVPAPYVVDHLQTDTRMVAQDGDRLDGRINLYVTKQANGIGVIPLGQGDQVRLVTSGRVYKYDDDSDFSERAGFVRYLCVRLDGEV